MSPPFAPSDDSTARPARALAGSSSSISAFELSWVKCSPATIALVELPQVAVSSTPQAEALDVAAEGPERCTARMRRTQRAGDRGAVGCQLVDECGAIPFKQEQPNVPLSNGELSGLPCIGFHLGCQHLL